LTVKHSLERESDDDGMPLAESPLNVARQQYRPAEVTHAVGEATVAGYAVPVRPRPGPGWPLRRPAKYPLMREPPLPS
jgi:hypothetical protein